MSQQEQACFWCTGDSDYHPTCGRPGFDRETHGFGSGGKRTKNYCETHRA